MAERSDGEMVKRASLVCCTRKKRLKRCLSLFIYLCLKNKLGLCSINCHAHAMAVNCSGSLTESIRYSASSFCDDRRFVLIYLYWQYLDNEKFVCTVLGKPYESLSSILVTLTSRSDSDFERSEYQLQ